MRTTVKIEIEEPGIYVLSDFEGEPAAIEQALDELVVSDPAFTKLYEGMYHKSRWISLMNCYGASSPDDIVKAIMRQTGEIITRSDAVAANGLGFTTQVQAQLVYCTNRDSRIMRIGPWKIQLVRANTEVMPFMGTPCCGVIQALSWQGEAVAWQNSREYVKILSKLPARIKSDLIYRLDHNFDWFPEWMLGYIETAV